jgi:RHS repeat-associated protein
VDPTGPRNYYRARYYDPKIGRFLSEDPIPIGQRKLEELNPYAYVANNPVNFIDPSGAQCFILGTQTPVIDPYIMWGRQPPVFRPFPNQTFNEAARPVRPTPPRPFVPQPQPLPVIDPTPAQIGPRMPWWLKLWKGLVEPWYDEAPAVPAKPDDKCGCVA